MAAFLLLSCPAAAQDQPAGDQPPAVEVPAAPPANAADPVPATPLQAESQQSGINKDDPLLGIVDAKRQVRDASVTPDKLKTLFFTAWQMSLLQEAKLGLLTTEEPVPDISSPQQEGEGEPPPPVDPGIREISLGGIAFSSPGRWTIWLNGMRVTPDQKPEQVLDLKVRRTHIDLKWFDAYTNRIYPIRLRPQERFNLDSRIFLPGTGAM